MSVSVQAITFEAINIETSFLVWWYILTISRSSLRVKVIPRSNCKCLTSYWQAGGGPSTERLSCIAGGCLRLFTFCVVRGVTTRGDLPKQKYKPYF